MKNTLNIKGAIGVIKGLCVLVGGTLGRLLGGCDKMLIILCLLICLDYVTGIMKSVYKKKLSSEIGWRGIVKKVMFLIIVMVAYLAQQVFGNAVPLREMTICFFIANEALSVLENAAAMGIPLPKKLLSVLKQLHDDSDEGKMPYNEKPKNEPPEGVS